MIERNKINSNKTINNYTNSINNNIENARKHKSFKTFNNYFYDYQFKNKLKINETINIQSNKEMIILSSTLDDENGKHKKNDNYELSNYELNNLKYEDFIQLDKRNFIQIYWALLKRENLLFFTFFSKDDFNLFSAKLARFIFLLCTDMVLNLLFFSDDSMNKIFLTYGKYDFIQKIPQMIYTVIVSSIIDLLICFLILTDKAINQIKKLKFKNYVNTYPIFRIIKIKLIVFFALTIVLLTFYWYIISTFCAVYKNTQNIFLKDSFFSFLLGLIYNIILYIIPSILKVICRKYKDSNMKILYRLSYILPFI